MRASSMNPANRLIARFSPELAKRSENLDRRFMRGVAATMADENAVAGIYAAGAMVVTTAGFIALDRSGNMDYDWCKSEANVHLQNMKEGLKVLAVMAPLPIVGFVAGAVTDITQNVASRVIARNQPLVIR